MSETIINEQQDRRIEDIHKKIETRVSWSIFIWAIGIVLIIVGVIVNYSIGASNKADNAIQKSQTIEGDIKSINTSMGFIIRSLDEIKLEIKR